MISIILPVYRNEDFLEELTARIHTALDGAGIEHEIIGVNDCCPGSSFAVLQRIASHDPRMVVVDLKQNSGQHRAVLSGLTCARGDWFGVMDADLQDPPEWLPRLCEIAVEHRAVVFAGRRGRYESVSRLITSRVFKSILALVAGVPRDAGMYFVAPAGVGKKLLGMRTSKPFVVAMLGRVPVPMISHPVERSRRPSGVSGYTSPQRLAAGMRAIYCALQCRLAGRFGVIPDYASNVSTVVRGKEPEACQL